ncbi:hypothetical protein ACUX3E_24815, partial [Salmonella enterica]
AAGGGAAAARGAADHAGRNRLGSEGADGDQNEAGNNQRQGRRHEHRQGEEREGQRGDERAAAAETIGERAGQRCRED